MQQTPRSSALLDTFIVIQLANKKSLTALELSGLLRGSHKDT